MDAAYPHRHCRWQKGVALIQQIPFFQHDLGKTELDAIAEVFAGTILTTGDTVSRFESEFASYFGCKHALGVTSCTGAMHMALLALGVGSGDEVITTPMTFIATATAFIESGARPVFVDVEPDTGNIDASKIEMNKSFSDDLEVDSLSMVEVVVAAEERFGVKIPDDEVTKMATVGDAVNFIVGAAK